MGPRRRRRGRQRWSRVGQITASMGPRRRRRGRGYWHDATATATASMGPRRSRRGRDRYADDASRDGASMGPRRSRRGRHSSPPRDPRDPASMGPRRRRRGRQFRRRHRRQYGGFNGATTKASWKTLSSVGVARLVRLQWGHDEVVVEGIGTGALRPRRRRRFNGATTKESWKGQRAVTRAGVYGFNGATTKASWKRSYGVTPSDRDASMGPRRRSRGRRAVRLHAPTDDQSASMGPRRRSRGRGRRHGRQGSCCRCFNGATTKASWKGMLEAFDTRRLLTCFNGATTKASWKARTTTHANRPLTALQWGHDEGVVEGERRARRPGRSTVASMGPRRRRRGRRLAEDDAPARLCFNGATTKSSWKAAAITRRRLTALQWGHDEVVVEGGLRLDFDTGSRCFNGATTKSSWKGGQGRHVDGRRRFNGATTKSSWKAASLRDIPASRSLQWGHDEVVVEGPHCAWAR